LSRATLEAQCVDDVSHAFADQSECWNEEPYLSANGSLCKKDSGDDQQESKAQRHAGDTASEIWLTSPSYCFFKTAGAIARQMPAQRLGHETEISPARATELSILDILSSAPWTVHKSYPLQHSFSPRRIRLIVEVFNVAASPSNVIAFTVRL